MTPRPSELASVALLGFLAIELLMRRGAAARSWKAGASDRGSTLVIASAYTVIVACLVFRFPGPHFPLPIRWVGAVIALVGVGLRAAAFRTLGSSYSRTLRINEGQELVRRGIYRQIRHPGYLSSIVIWGGAVVASGSIIATVAALAALVIAYSYRIDAEERMLAASFGSRYEEYQKASWRLVPYVY